MFATGVFEKETKARILDMIIFSMDDDETILLIDSWENQEAIDNNHKTPMMNKIMELREKYNLHMKFERYISDDEIPQTDIIY